MCRLIGSELKSETIIVVSEITSGTAVIFRKMLSQNSLFLAFVVFTSFASCYQLDVWIEKFPDKLLVNWLSVGLFYTLSVTETRDWRFWNKIKKKENFTEIVSYRYTSIVFGRDMWIDKTISVRLWNKGNQCFQFSNYGNESNNSEDITAEKN